MQNERLNNIMMPIQAYQFIKYNKSTSTEYVEKVLESGAVICFDFEDGINNPLNMDMSALLKDEAREQFLILYSKIIGSVKNIKVGIRINNSHSADFEKDLIALSDKSFDSVFAPKIQHPEDINFIIDKLNTYKIEFNDFIPIIESMNGLENLESVLKLNPMISKIAFGHCDYNLDIGAYPFFHQDSRQYWIWIADMKKKTEKYGVRLLNSAYLDYGNETFFCSMLDYIAAEESCFYGQFTLTSRQTELCNHRKLLKVNFKNLIKNKNLISADKQIAFDLVNEFETYNKHKGLTKSKNRFISLQEYIASKELTTDVRDVKEMCFAGGCFPVQHNIVYEKLFHQILKRKVENNSETRLSISIIRYERLSTLLDKIEEYVNSKNPELIVFHVRPEPYLRLIKLFYKHADNKGRLKWSLNLPYFNHLNPEKYDMLDLRRIYNVRAKKRNSILHKFLISLNYILGTMIRNKQYALKSYYVTTNRIIDFCNENNIKYCILGPNRRNKNLLEPFLCKSLDIFFSDRIKKQNYICGYMYDIKKMNQENGMHVTQEYHDLTAEKLYQATPLLNMLTPSVSKSITDQNKLQN